MIPKSRPRKKTRLQKLIKSKQEEIDELRAYIEALKSLVFKEEFTSTELK